MNVDEVLVEERVRYVSKFQNAHLALYENKNYYNRL